MGQSQGGADVLYQPVGRFWTFQLIEGGWLLALAVALLAATAWLVRDRAGESPRRPIQWRVLWEVALARGAGRGGPGDLDVPGRCLVCIPGDVGGPAGPGQ